MEVAPVQICRLWGQEIRQSVTPAKVRLSQSPGVRTVSQAQEAGPAQVSTPGGPLS